MGFKPEVIANPPPVTALAGNNVTQEVGPRVKGAEDGAQGVAVSAGFEREGEGQDRRKPWVILEPSQRGR